MSKRSQRRKKQENAVIPTLVLLCIGGAAISVNQQPKTFIAVVVAIAVLVILVFVFLFMRERRQLERLARSGINEVDQMDGIQFEKYLQVLLLRNGYKNVKLTTIYDLGVDLIAEKDGVR